MHLWRRIPNSLWFVAAAGLATAWIAWAAEDGNLHQLHRHAVDHADECTACHGEPGMVDTSTDPRVQTIGPMKLSSPLLNFTCVTCHRSVDLDQHSAAASRIQVDPLLCVKCHGVSRCPKRPRPSARRSDCVGCHKDWASQMKAHPDASLVHIDKITPADCWKCHGGIALFRVPQR